MDGTMVAISLELLPSTRRGPPGSAADSRSSRGFPTGRIHRRSPRTFAQYGAPAILKRMTFNEKTDNHEKRIRQRHFPQIDHIAVQ